MNLTGLDIAIITVPLVGILAVSVYLRRYMRSVADFLAANRCAGRYLIATAGAETSASVMSMIVALEVFSRVGWSLEFWQSFINLIFFFLGLLGLVGYRFRQTRALTFHQFFEVRYSKRTRIFASFLYAMSGALTFGVQPAVGARFFIYFCGLPETMHLAGLTVPSFIPLMILLMALSLYFALTGGQISVMVTDCLEGVLSSVLYLVIAGFIVYALSVSQLREAMLSGPPGASYVDPFDIGGRTEFNGWFVLIGATLSLSWFRGNAWNQGSAAAAKTPHEGRMAAILGTWRGHTYTAMSALVALGAFTLMHNSAFAAQRAAIDQSVQNISVEQLRTQMRMPIAIASLLAPGIRGCFCAVLLFGLLAGQGQLLHNYGSTFLQDVFLPALTTKPLSTRAHLFCLKATLIGVAVFAVMFSVWYKPIDYLVLAMQLLGTLYLGGVGMVVWGGLYWKKGTTAGAWTSLLTGSVLSITLFGLQQFWKPLHPWLIGRTGTHGTIGAYLARYPDKIPINGQQLSLMVVALCAIGYFSVSWLTCKRDFNLDALLHRGKYRVATDDAVVASGVRRSWLGRLLNIDEHFTRGDKALTYATFGWTVFWQSLAAGLLVWVLLVGRLSARWWFDYRLVTSIGVALALAVPTTVWFTIGVARDLWELRITLRTTGRSEVDDGTVVGHHNAEDAVVVAASSKVALTPYPELTR